MSPPPCRERPPILTLEPFLERALRPPLSGKPDLPPQSLLRVLGGPAGTLDRDPQGQVAGSRAGCPLLGPFTAASGRSDERLVGRASAGPDPSSAGRRGTLYKLCRAPQTHRGRTQGRLPSSSSPDRGGPPCRRCQPPAPGSAARPLARHLQAACWAGSGLPACSPTSALTFSLLLTFSQQCQLPPPWMRGWAFVWHREDC